MNESQDIHGHTQLDVDTCAYALKLRCMATVGFDIYCVSQNTMPELANDLASRQFSKYVSDEKMEVAAAAAAAAAAAGGIAAATVAAAAASAASGDSQYFIAETVAAALGAAAVEAASVASDSVVTPPAGACLGAAATRGPMSMSERGE